MKILINTTNKEEADKIEREAIEQYGHLAVWVARYWGNDGKYHHEVQIHEHWIGFKGWNN